MAAAVADPSCATTTAAAAAADLVIERDGTNADVVAAAAAILGVIRDKISAAIVK